MATKTSQQDEVKTRLKQLHDTPVAIASEEDLQLLTNYLLGPATQTATRRFDHWFCSRATEVTNEAAKFLIRLRAYNNVRVEVWKQQLRTCLAECCECVRGFQQAKVTSRDTYFGAFRDDILEVFYASLDQWELEFVLGGLSQLSLDSGNNSRRTLSDVQPAIVFHIFSNLHILQDSRIAQMVHALPPKNPIVAWPSDFPPPGLFYTLLDEKPEVREWAFSQIGLCKTAPMSADSFFSDYRTAIKLISTVVSDQAGMSNIGASLPLPFIRDTSVLWSSFATILRFVPVELFRPRDSFDLDLRHAVAGHLNDTGSRQSFFSFRRWIHTDPLALYVVYIFVY